MTKFFVVVLVILVVGLAIRQFMRTGAGQTQKQPGFREFVKNPEHWHDMIAEHQKVDATAEQAESWNAEEIRSNVVRYVSASETPRELWGLGRALKSLSPRTNDALLSILSGSDYFTGASMLDVSRITNCEHVVAINDSPLQWS